MSSGGSVRSPRHPAGHPSDVSVKICGLTRAEDAAWAAEAGADFLGVIVTDGFSRSVSPHAAAAVLGEADVPRVAVTVDEAPTDVARIAETVGASVVQLHGSEGRADIEILRSLGPWRIWKAIRARGLDDVLPVVGALRDVVDGFLVEGWREGVVGGGGVRLTVDGDPLARAMPPDRDFVLAGGLDHTNVSEAVARSWPDVVDVSSGVERQVGIKDPALVQAFILSAGGCIVVPSSPPKRDTT